MMYCVALFILQHTYTTLYLITSQTNTRKIDRRLDVFSLTIFKIIFVHNFALSMVLHIWVSVTTPLSTSQYIIATNLRGSRVSAAPLSLEAYVVMRLCLQVTPSRTCATPLREIGSPLLWWSMPISMIKGPLTASPSSSFGLAALSVTTIIRRGPEIRW